MKRFLSFIGLLFCAIACKNTSAPATGQIIAQQEITNQIYFAAKPIVSAHRGGGGEGLKGYPENCLESIQYLSSKGVHSFEIDIFESLLGRSGIRLASQLKQSGRNMAISLRIFV